MPVPSPRNSIRIARGNYADLAANVTEIGEGELCFALDQDKFYSKSNGALVAVGGGTELYSLAQIADVDVTGVTSGQVLVWDGTSWSPEDQATGGGGAVDSVNGQTGAVVLVVSDLANDANYITAAEAPVQISDLPTNNNQLLNGAGYITAADVPVDSVNGETGAVVLGAADVGAIAPGEVNPVYFLNQADFPDVIASHGGIAHSHADGAMYFSHDNLWNRMANTADLPTDNNELTNGAGYITSSALPVNVSELNNDAGYLTTETVNNIDLDVLPSLP